MSDLYNFLNDHIAYFYLIICVPLLIGFTRFRRLGVEQKILVIVVLIALINELLATHLRMRGINNYWVYHLYVPLSFVFVVRIYREVLSSSFGRRFFDLLSIGFLLLAIFNSLFLQSIEVFNSNAISLSSIVYIALAIAYFYQLLRNTAFQGLGRTPMFWLNAGILISYSGMLILNVLINYVVGQDETAELMIGVWGLNILFNVILNVFYSIALWLNPRV